MKREPNRRQRKPKEPFISAPFCPPGLSINPSSRREVPSMYCLNTALLTHKLRPSRLTIRPAPPALRTSSPSSSNRLDQRRDQQTGHRLRLPVASCRPGSSLPAVAGPAGSTSAAAAVRIVPQGYHIGPVAARSRGPAGMGWASRSSRCCWADPAGTAVRRLGYMDRHLGG